MNEPVREPHRITVPYPREEAAMAAAEAVELWGGEWGRQDGAWAGQVKLPIRAGLRFGVLGGELEISAARGGAEIVLRPQSATYFLNTTAVAVLLIAALGALLLILWPFFPQHEVLAQIAPLGALLALGGWFLVLTRLESRGPDEFLSLVSELAEHGVVDVGEGEGGDEPPRAVEPG